jgi:endonuclease G
MKPHFLALVLLFVPSIALSSFKSPNCPIGCPSLDIEGNTVVFERLYALSQNPQTKFADWVAYEVDVLNFGPTTNRTWKNNPLLDEDIRLEKGDYTGASKALGVDRGHQAPLASFVGSRYWPTLNYLSNITPQSKGLNQGPWKELEEAVRDAVGFRDSLYVITGPLYQKEGKELPGADESHVIPSGYYKIVYNLKGEAAAFVMGQDIERGFDYCETTKQLKDVKALLSYSLPSSLKSNDVILEKMQCRRQR